MCSGGPRYKAKKLAAINELPGRYHADFRQIADPHPGEFMKMAGASAK
jgi:hypothetical protein